MTTADPLQQYQLDMAARLQSRRQLRGIKVEALRPRSQDEATMIQDGINKALTTLASDEPTAGLVILVPLPAFDVTGKNNPSPLGDVIVSVQILENVMINEGPGGTGITAEGAAIIAMLAGHHFSPRSDRALYADEVRPLDVDKQEWSADIAYEVRFKVHEGFQQEPECQMPRLVESAGVVTVTTATAGASCLVTLDGSLPWSGNPEASPIANGGTFTPPTGTTLIRAVTIKDGINDSSPAELNLA